MKKEDFRSIDSEEEFVALLKQHDVYREDDVTFDGLEEGGLYVYTGDAFVVDMELFAELELTSLLVVGSVQLEFLRVSDVLDDFGVFCITGALRCKDLLYATESTGVMVGGDLRVDNIAYLDCGNSVLQVNGDLHAKLSFNVQCSVEVRGEEHVELDESVESAQLAAVGLEAGDDVGEAVRAYFDKYDED